MNAMTSQTVPLVFSLREQIVDRLRNDVLCGRISEGENLTEIGLVQRFGVSRTPIREALQQLTHEGLLESRPNAGVKVAPVPPDAVRQLVVPIRRSIETFALRSYFGTLLAEDFRRWKTILEQMKSACRERDYIQIAESDIAFHRSIVSRAGFKEIESMWMSMLARVRSHFQASYRLNYNNLIDVYREHDRLVEVFKSGDLEESIKALEENIE